MNINPMSSRPFFTRLSFAAVLAIGALVGFGTGVSFSIGDQLMSIAVVAALAAVTTIWLFWPRSRERAQAVWNAYAVREMTQTPRSIGQRSRTDHSKLISSRRNT